MSTQDPDGTIHIEDDEATGAVKTGAMRWVLGISLTLTIIALSAVWITGALTQGEVESEGTLSDRIEAASPDEDDGATDVVDPSGPVDTTPPTVTTPPQPVAPAE
ncbi:hypothetical protein LY632_04940 [Erythrobacter sp. SDW2]|uniref:hypothetical protein n=1 Tax=Erythrobacter sp. SDW2 TaxID=2907154 RepID=UPI001F18C5ED|nr:hypothetical protein [Erythrobacter sp. SDW2]UIP07748.1 hypothetical protein LY632_04940 [Erythrobacter sp. SDW2]